MKVEWTRRLDASCWHTLLAVQSGVPLVDSGLEAKLRSLAPFDDGLADRLDESASAALANSTDPTDARLLELLSGCRRLLAPDGDTAFDHELRLRGGPIREQWDARGPGLMRQIGRLTEPMIGARAAVALVAPVAGGHGHAFADAGLVTFEAVLTNPAAELPEVLRLAWLLAQLSGVDGGEASRIALVAATLAGAEEVELATLKGPALERALGLWRVTENPISTAAALLPWWGEYRGSPTPWPMAVADLASRLA